MKVIELIEKLKDFDFNADVILVRDGEDQTIFSIYERTAYKDVHGYIWDYKWSSDIEVKVVYIE